MAAYHGRDGQVRVDPAGGGTEVALGEVTAWSYSETAEETEAPAMGLTSKRYLAGLTEAGGSFTLNFDDGDATAQALDVGDSVNLELYPRGAGSSYPMLTSTGNDASDLVVITGIEYSGDVGSVITRTYTFRNNLVAGTQPA